MNKKTISIACLSLSVIIVISIAGFLAFTYGILALIFNSMKSNPVYEQSMSLIKNDPSVQEIFGTPIKDGFFIGGETSTNVYGSGHANFSVAIRGPKASGNASIRGMKNEGEDWYVDGIEIRVNQKPALIYSESDHAFHPWK